MKTYNQYTTEDFLNDLDFNSWLEAGFTNNETLTSIRATNGHNSEINAAIDIALALKKNQTQSMIKIEKKYCLIK